MNTKIFLLLLGLLLISVRTQNDTQPNNTTTGGDNATTTPDEDDEGTNEETPSDKDLCLEKNTDKDGCFKVQLSSDDKKCCFYDVTPPEGDKYTICLPKLNDEEKKETEDGGIEFKEECSGKFIATSILALLALLFL